MKKILFFSIALLFSFEGVHAANYICSDTTHIGTTIQFVYCAEDYFPKYDTAHNPHILIEEPVTFLIDMGESSIYSINGHVELTSLDLMDFCIIRETDEDTTTIRNLGVFTGVHDIQLYTQRTRYIAVDIYCFMGAVSSTSGITLNISPVEQTSFINATIADKLGIGTTDPTTSLEVVGDVKIRTTGTKNITISPKTQRIDFTTNTDNFCFDKPIQSSLGVFSSSSTSNLTLQTYNTPRMTILKDNGYVGIGTTEPQEMLHVKGYLRGSGGHGCLTISTECGTTTIGCDSWAYSHFYTNRNAFYFDKKIVIRDGELSSGSAYDLFLKTYNTVDSEFHKRMTILRNSGYVGIGIENPQYKLDVAGKIHSDTLITTHVQADTLNSELIQANYALSDSIRTKIVKCGAVFVESVYGADYVFDNNYNLRPLQEVSSYIQENGHLPEIQSAADMQQNGMNISDFQIQLLQKIEELTLYIIRQDERIRDLEKQLSK